MELEEAEREIEIGEGPESQANQSLKWCRPSLPASLDPSKDSITFQQIDIDHYTAFNVMPNMPGAQVIYLFSKH